MIQYVRNDLVTFTNGVNGGKAICIKRLLDEAISDGYKGVVTSGSRTSPQIEIVSQMTKELGLTCDIFVPKGQPTNILKFIEENTDAVIHTSNAGYTSTATGQAKKYCIEHNLAYIPFGCECYENLECIYKVMMELPLDTYKRIVVPIGSGTAFVGIVNALNQLEHTEIEVLGVQVGMDPQKTIDKFMVPYNEVKYTIVKAEQDYKEFYPNPVIDGIELDPQYEAKCIPFLKEDDTLWIVGRRLIY